MGKTSNAFCEELLLNRVKNYRNRIGCLEADYNRVPEQSVALNSNSKQFCMNIIQRLIETNYVGLRRRKCWYDPIHQMCVPERIAVEQEFRNSATGVLLEERVTQVYYLRSSPR